MESKPKSSSLEKHSPVQSPPKSLHSIPPHPQLAPRHNKVVLGICAMRKKVESKPMREILSRLACP